MTAQFAPSQTFDAVVIGTGPVGLATALALSEVLDRVAVVGPGQRPEGRREDRRTAALFAGSIDFLRNLDVWPACEGESAPLEAIRLVDARDAILRAPEVLFSARDVSLSAFGYNVPNWALSSALWDRVHGRADQVQWIETEAATSIQDRAGVHVVSCKEEHAIGARIVVGADGRHSICRAAAGIETQNWSYPQTAVTCTFHHDRAHNGISTEFHTKHGPCTVVPMPANTSSLVWVTSNADADRLMACDTDQFGGHLEDRLGGLLGTIDNITPRTAFPLQAMIANAFASNATFLVGEAAHVIPPIGAQGLNLGLRDAAELADVFAEHGANTPMSSAGAAYNQRRRFDVRSRTTAVDLFNRSLLSPILPAHLARGAGLHLLNAIAPLKNRVIREGLMPSTTSAVLLRPGGIQRLRARVTQRASRSDQHDGSSTTDLDPARAAPHAISS